MLRKFMRICVTLVMVVMLGLSVTPVCATDTQPSYLETYNYNFDDEQDGTHIYENGAYTEYFIYKSAGGSNITSALYATEGDNRYVTIKGYNEFMSNADIMDYPYEFSVDVRHGEVGRAHAFGIFARGVMPGVIRVPNPLNNGISQDFQYYEADWYGGTEKQTGGIGGSGVALIMAQDRVSIVVKVYVDSHLYLAEERVDVQLPDTYRLGEFNNWKVVEDTNEQVSFYVNDVLLGTVRFSDPGMEYEAESGYQYYETAEILDAEGNVLKTVEDARINCDGSQIAFASRFVEMDIDNLYVGLGADQDTTSTPEPTPTPSQDPSTTPPSESIAPTNTLGSSNQQDGVPAGVIIGIIVGVVAVAAAVVVIVLILKKKKK